MNKMIKKVVSVAFVALLTMIGVANPVLAGDDLLFGQSHYYTVVFRGNGEAITYAKIAFTNPDEKPLTDFSFEVPKSPASEMVIYQVKLPGKCKVYIENSCSEYEDVDYTQDDYESYSGYDYGYGSSYSYRKAEYQKIKYEKVNNKYKFSLPTSVAPYKSSAIIVAYASKAYVTQSFGLYKYKFETLKVPSRIQSVNVAVDVDSELFLKGKKSSVDYNESDTESVLKSSSMAEGISSNSLDKISRNVGNYGSSFKSAKNLAADESFVVKGEYAKSWYRLNLKSIVISLAMIIGFFVGLYYLTKFLRKRALKNAKAASLLKKSVSSESQPTIDQSKTNQETGTNFRIFSFINVIAGLLSVTLLLFVFFFTWRFDIYSIDIFSSYGGFIASFVALLVGLSFVTSIFGPAVFMGIKRGWKHFWSVLLMESLWYVVILIFFLVLMISTRLFIISEPPYRNYSSPGPEQDYNVIN